MKALLVLFLQALLCVHAAKRFRDVLPRARQDTASGGQPQLQGWSPDGNFWDEKSYPAWAKGDSRWKNCWKGGKVVVLLTSDGPALVGSNVTFAATLQFPRCQKEDANGDIVYEQSENCRNVSSLAGEYVYNWTQWMDYCNMGSCYNASGGYFPDGKPFPFDHDHRSRRNFIYIFHTLGQYFQQVGGSAAFLSINTTNITVGTQLMEVTVYRKGRRQHTPVTTASGIYIVTDEIPFFVNISQKIDRNASDEIFIKDSPIDFTVKLHDPSGYLSSAAIAYNWSFGDGSGSFVSNSPMISHTYTLQGNFSLNLTVKAAIPGPCRPVTPTPSVPTTTVHPTNSTNTTLDEEDLLATFNQTTTSPATTSPAVECVIYRYGYYNTRITIVEGILEVNILQMTSVEVSAAQANSVFDFVVTCAGSIPTDACTVISDSTCMVPQETVCDPVAATTNECLLTLRRSFSQPGTYCVNISLSDPASLALASTLLSVGESGSARTVGSVLLPLGFLVVLVSVAAFFLYKRYKQYKPIESHRENVTSEGVGVHFHNMKAVFVTKNNEKRPLLKEKAGII